MTKIQTAINLQDNFSPVLQNMVGFINLTMSSMLQMQQTLSQPFEAVALQGMQEYANQTTIAMRRLQASLESVSVPDLPSGLSPLVQPVSWQWQTDAMPVFSSFGIERFEQELSSVNSRLNTLYNTQAQIAAAASRIDWLPDNAQADLGNMQNRLQAIWQQVNLIGSNPLNFGSDFANQELERMRSQLALAVQQQERLNSAVAGMDVQAANSAYLQLSQTVGGLESYIRDNIDAQGEFNEIIQEGAANASNLGGFLAGAVKTYLGLAGLRKAIDFGRGSMSAFDVQMNAEVQLATVAGNMGMSDYYDQMLAQAAEIQGRGIYGDEIMIAGAAELSTYFHDGDAVLSMMDTLSNYAAGMSGGGELNAQQMTDYATGLGKVMSGSYDAMTKKGFEFSDAQKAIIEGTASHVMIAETLGAEYLNMSADMQAAAAINQVIAEGWGGLYEAMSSTPQGQIIQLSNAFGDLQEQVGLGLYPYVMLVVEAFQDNWPTIERVVQGVAGGFNNLLGILSWVVEAGVGVAGALVDNWAWVAPLVYGAAAALGVYKIVTIASNIQKGIAAVVAYAHAVAIGSETAATYAATAAQYGFNAALLTCPITWVVAGIIAGSAALIAFCSWLAKSSGAAQTTFGAVAGCVNVVWQLLVNLAKTAVNIGLAIGGAFLACAVNIGVAFNNAISSVKSGFWSLAANACEAIADIAQRLNALPFIEFDYSGLDAKANEYAARAARAESHKAEYVNVWDVASKGLHTFDVFQEGWAAEAFAAGANWGDNFNLFGVQELDMSAYDMLNKGPWEDMSNSLAEIAGNTGDMAHELSMTDEDLKYMRDIAERDTVNRYTTAEIVLHMGGITNNVSKMDDLDGITTKLVDNIIQEIEIGAEGLHI